MLQYMIFIAVYLSLPSIHGQEVYRQSNGALLIRDGIVNLVGFTGTVFQVINYTPVCGTLSSSLSRQSDLSDKCTAAMSTFNTTSVTAGIYDLSGVPSSDLPGGGTQLCICAAFGTSSAKPGDPNSNGLLCFWVDEKGSEENWWSGQTDTRVASSFQMSAQGKALPPCNSVDLASLSAASLATRTSAVSSATPKATSTASSGLPGSSASSSEPSSTGVQPSSVASGTPNEKGNPTFSSGTIAGFVIAAVALIATALAAGLCYCHGRKPSQAVSSKGRSYDDSASSAWAESTVFQWRDDVRRNEA